MERKRVLEYKERLNTEIDGMTLDQVVMHFIAIKNSYEKEILNDKQVCVCNYYECYNCGTFNLYICVFRWENDDEFNKRQQEEIKKQEKVRKIRETKQANMAKKLAEKEAKEFAEYRRLKDKFENADVR